MLGEYVQHHIKEEESEIFPQVTRAKLDRDNLVQLMQMRRETLEEELLPEGASGGSQHRTATETARSDKA